jgi:hypothetical protein
MLEHFRVSNAVRVPEYAVEAIPQQANLDLICN